MKYEKLGFCIIVNISNNYQVRANILKVPESENTYDFTLEIKRMDKNRWEEISDKGSYNVYRLGSQSINYDVASYISRIEKEGFFTTVINNYEELIHCEEIGIKVLNITRDVLSSGNCYVE